MYASLQINLCYQNALLQYMYSTTCSCTLGLEISIVKIRSWIVSTREIKNHEIISLPIIIQLKLIVGQAYMYYCTTSGTVQYIQRSVESKLKVK